MSELLPCPFCGGEPKFAEVGSELSKSRKLTIQCKGCRFKLTNAAMRHGFDWLYEITIAAWNHRHSGGDGEDAARYRYQFTGAGWDYNPNWIMEPKEVVDAAIDAARAGERGVA